MRKLAEIAEVAVLIIAIFTATVGDVKFIYADGMFFLPVVQQPLGDPEFVSIGDNLTQFSLVSSRGNIGIVAHNTLEGKWFSKLTDGQKIFAVFDDRVEIYTVDHARIYQSLDPSNPYGDLKDLSSAEVMSAGEVFEDRKSVV